MGPLTTWLAGSPPLLILATARTRNKTMTQFVHRCLGTALFVAACLAINITFADEVDARRDRNWPQWRGPRADGMAPHGDPPVEWSEDKNIRWKVPVPGEGSATPIIWDDRVFLATAIETDRETPQPPAADDAKTQPPAKIFQFVVLCLDRATGRELWRQVACEEVPHEGRHPTNTYASASPVTDGQRLYVWFGSRGLFCFDLDGNPLWQRHLGRLRTRFGWGEGASPAVHGDWVVANCDQEEQSFLAAIDAATGEIRWRVDRDEVTSWATPLIVEQQGRMQVVVNGTNRVRGYDLETGSVIWECGGQTVNAIPSPLAMGDAVLCMSGYRGACARAIPLNARGDITDSDTILWRHDEGTPYVPSPIVVGGRVYFTAANIGVLTCLDAATGAAVYDRQRLPGLSNVYASPASAAGRIYFVGRDGATVVLRDGPALDVLATNQLDDPIDASPAIVGRQMFLRGARHLYCIEDQSTAAIDRALTFLSTEVARWPAENGCFSCHNHGDGARALYTAQRLGLTVDTGALAETTAWLKQPDRWQHQTDSEEFSDPRLTPIQFASALATAMQAGTITDRQPLLEAAAMIADLQSADGSWPSDAAGAVGSPVTYGTALVTAAAARTLIAADPQRFGPMIDLARRWLADQQPTTVLAAASLLPGATQPFPAQPWPKPSASQRAVPASLAPDPLAPSAEQQAVCLDVIRRAQHSGGGWGPYEQSSPEPFDTAVVLLALAGAGDAADSGAIELGGQYLLACQEPDGSWPETTRPSGAESYAQRMSTTAWATLALMRVRASTIDRR
jgi:outer membrane protein assembly factor BamB